ncbi:vacuolar protein sorting-associated protein VTA1 homolog [Amphiura filiformis]|uniref:vacuolar protein sorting-associated protein VTA1 homolog n=1 Tax=Amphiura filiformis TaxID=82378 RepID=UPI003B227BD0
MALKGSADVPAGLKPIKPYISVAREHDVRDPVVAYFCRRFAMEKAMSMPNTQPEDKKFLMFLMTQLEKSKKELAGHEALKSEVVGQAQLENHALKVFLWADNEDRAGRFNKNVVKSFYTSSLLFDVMSTFEEPPEEIEKTKKYAKWKATYINQCLKSGETPQPGPLDDGLQPGEHPSTSDAGYAGYPPQQPGFSGYPPQQPTAGYPPPQQPTAGYPPPQQPGASGYPPPNQQPGRYPANNHLQPGHVPPGLHAPPSTPEQPGVYQGGTGIPGPSAAAAAAESPTGGPSLSVEDFTKAQKYCKYASSALQYEDTPSAIDNLEKALRLLKTGKE